VQVLLQAAHCLLFLYRPLGLSLPEPAEGLDSTPGREDPLGPDHAGLLVYRAQLAGTRKETDSSRIFPRTHQFKYLEFATAPPLPT